MPRPSAAGSATACKLSSVKGDLNAIHHFVPARRTDSDHSSPGAVYASLLTKRRQGGTARGVLHWNITVFFRVLALAAALLPIRAATLIRDVSIVDLTSGRVVPHSSVLISGGDIKLVGPVPSVRRPPGAAVVDGRGRYLMPGLWDMHVHLWYGQNEFPLFLSWGITGVRDMGSTLERTRAWQHAVDAG